MKRLVLKQLLFGFCVIAGTAWAETAVEKPKETLWTYVPPTWKAPDAKKLSGTLELGNKQQDGSTSIQEISGVLNLKYDPGMYEVVENLEYDYLDSQDTVSKNQLKSYTGFDYYMGCRTWAFVMNDYERNPPQHIQRNLRTGGGLKYDFLRNSFWKLNLGAAVLNRQQISTEDREEDDAVMSCRLLFKVKSNSTAYSLVAFYLPSLQNSTYQWSADTSLTFDLNTWVAFKIGYQYTFNSAPLDPGVSKWDSQYYTRLVLKY